MLSVAKVPGYTRPQYPRYYKSEKFHWLPAKINGKTYWLEKTYCVAQVDFAHGTDHITFQQVRKKDYKGLEAKKLWQLYEKMGNLLKDK